MKPLAFVALAAVVLSGCTGTAPSPTPAPSLPAATSPSSADAVVAELLGRPVAVPPLAQGSACPRSPAIDRSPVNQPAAAKGLGNAPIYPLAFYAGSGALPLPTATTTPDGLFEMKIVWASSDDYEGPAVVRVARADGPGRGYIRLYYDREASRGDATVLRVSRTPRDWPSGTFVSGPGCYAYQVDGVGFSELIYFSVVP